MRSNQNLQGSSNRGVASKLGMTRMPVEWLDAGSWRLPSGKALAEFALQAGFLAPLLFQPERLGSGTATCRSAGSLKDRALRSPNKHFGKGSGQ
jgi:hypothetical protein